MQRLVRSACLALALAVPAVPPAVAGDLIYTGFLSNTAAGGHDVVAYFTEGRPVEGSSEHALEYKGVRWLFASEETRAAFEAEPERYAPQYGGHCAWAAAEGYTAAGDPDHWSIVEGRLYLNYNAEVQTRWEADIPGHIAAADRNWPALAAE